EFERKPSFHRVWANGLPEPMAWANPGGARLSARQLAEMMAGYYGMVAQLDHALGRVLRALDETGQADGTLVVVTTDHGELLGDHQMLFKGPLHYDGLLRVPLVVRGPAVRAGRVVTEPVGLIDLAPTVLEAARLPCPPTVEGRSLGALLAGEAPGRRRGHNEGGHGRGRRRRDRWAPLPEPRLGTVRPARRARLLHAARRSRRDLRGQRVGGVEGWIPGARAPLHRPRDRRRRLR